MRGVVTDLIADGYPAQEILLQLQAALLADAQASDAGERWVGWWLGLLQRCMASFLPPLPRRPPLSARRPPAPAAKGRVLVALAEADKALVDGADEFLQLLSAGSFAQRVLTGQA